MNSNLVSDTFEQRLKTVTGMTRVYRNEAPSKPTFPYIVYDAETINDSYPSDDYYIYVSVYEQPRGSVRNMNDIADKVDSIDDLVINNENLNMHIKKVLRQFVSANELTVSKAINLQYVARVYFK